MSILGEGSYGIVREIENRAVKHTIDDAFNVLEIYIPKHLNHPNIVKLLDYTIEHDGQAIVADLSFEILEKVESITKSLVRDWLEGLAFLHSKGILHMDPRKENLMQSEGVGKLIDFGISSLIERKEPEKVNLNFPYLAPEVVKNDEYPIYTPESEIWMFGCMLVDWLDDGWTAIERYKVLRNNPSHIYNMSKEQSVGSWLETTFGDSWICELVKMCLVWDPSKRATTSDIIRHLGFEPNIYEHSPLVVSEEFSDWVYGIEYPEDNTLIDRLKEIDFKL